MFAMASKGWWWWMMIPTDQVCSMMVEKVRSTWGLLSTVNNGEWLPEAMTAHDICSWLRMLNKWLGGWTWIIKHHQWTIGKWLGVVNYLLQRWWEGTVLKTSVTTGDTKKWLTTGLPLLTAHASKPFIGIVNGGESLVVVVKLFCACFQSWCLNITGSIW